jgi:hypothetical protein
MSQSHGSTFEDIVEQQLKELDLSFLPHPAVLGVRPDFVVTLPNGRLLVVEAKTSQTLAAAIRQVDLFVQALDAAGGIIAVPDSVHPADQPQPRIRIVRLSELADTLKALSLEP